MKKRLQVILLNVLFEEKCNKLENVAIANALQLEAARRRAVPLRINFVARAKFEVTQPTRCRLRAFILLIRYVML